ncbi:Protein of unknown function [Bacillus cereus]|nr:Protein of unknown function [Bacillus cereus]
MLLLFK